MDTSQKKGATIERQPNKIISKVGKTKIEQTADKIILSVQQ